MIEKNTPDTWQNLQNSVANLLEECGFSVEIERPTRGARGTVALDVYAEEVIDRRKYSIAVECKYWKSRVPQTIVHGFRTVVADTGIHKGYIVSMEGFQSGAFDASELTNISIMTWEEFQIEFLETWHDRYFTQKIAELSPLMTYCEPFLPHWFDQMSDEDKASFIALKEDYDSLGMFAQSLGPWLRKLGMAEIPVLPLASRFVAVQDSHGIPEVILSASRYRELLDTILDHGSRALVAFQKLKEKCNTPKTQ